MIRILEGRRRGFSLVELLVVIAIIAVLMGLTAAGVFYYVHKGPEAATVNEIANLSAAVGAFKQEFGVTHMPSRIRLVENGQYNQTIPLERDTAQFLQKMFGRRFNPAVPMDWNNNNNPTERLELQGHACLVFFLGGIPSRGAPNGCLGFGNATRNLTLSGQPVAIIDPVDVAANGTANSNNRRGPFYDFKSNRLLRGTNGNNGVPANMFAYADAFNKGIPYAYFSSGVRANNYADDCPNLSMPAIRPYQEAAGRFINPDGFQIISAGRDASFGPGGLWNPTLGYNNAGPGADDRSNFSSKALGAGRQ